MTARDDEFDDDAVIDDDLADDWEAELAAQDEADAKAAAAAEAAKNKGPRQKRFGGGGAGDYDADEPEDDVDDANLTEEERRARIEFAQQVRAAREAEDLFGGAGGGARGGGGGAAGLPELSDAPALATWAPSSSKDELRKVRERIVEVVSRFASNPNFSACLVPVFQHAFKGMNTASLEDVRGYLDSCKDKIEARRAQKKASAAADKEQKDKEAAAATAATAAPAAGGRQTQRAAETQDLFGSVQDRAGVNDGDDYSMF